MVRKRYDSLCESKLLSSSSSNSDDSDYDEDNSDSENSLSDNKATTTTLSDAWTLEESNSLLKLIRQQIPENDKHSYSYTVSKLNWLQASNFIQTNCLACPVVTLLNCLTVLCTCR